MRYPERSITKEHATATERDRLFASLRVRDIGHVLAGPFVASLLADLGAEVIQVELPDLAKPGNNSGTAMRAAV